MREVTKIIPVGKQAIPQIRVAAYCRVSTNSSDQINSYATQIRVYTNMINRNPDWELVEIFADEGISGTAADKRDEFMRMIRMCELRKIDLIITKSVSRFARNVKEALEYVRKLKLLGIGVRFEKEGINTLSLGDEMLLNTFSAIAQEESVSISQNVRFGIRKRMEKGSYVNGCVPFGYRLVDHKMIPYQPEAIIVQHIFQLYLSGFSVIEITKELEKEKVQTKLGKQKWNDRIVCHMLSNEKYVGDSLYQKKYREVTVPFTQHVNYGQEDQYYAYHTHEGIIDRETFDSVQRLLNARRKKHAGNLKSTQYPLTSHIRCTECGSFYRRRIVNGCVSWGCTQHIADRTRCDSQYYREERIYDAFIEIVNKLSFADENILEESIRLLEMAITMQKRNNTQAMVASQNLAELNTKLLMLEQLRCKGYLAAEIYQAQAKEINARIREIKKQRADLIESKLEIVREEIKVLQEKLKQYEEPLEFFDEGLFKDIVKSVSIDKKRKITFTLLGDLKFIETL